MSLPDTSDSGAIIAAFQADTGWNYTAYSMTALVAYEYVLTINQEIAMIWRRRWTLVTWLFMANRYLMIVLIIWDVVPSTAPSCFSGNVAGDILELVQYIVFAAFSALRVFAIWDRHIPMTLLVFVLNLVPVVTNMYAFIKSTMVFTVDPVFGPFCNILSNISVRATLQFSLGTRLALVVADMLVLALTWHKTFIHRVAAIRVGVRTPLSTMLLQDGTVYFVVLLAINIADIVVDAVPSLLNDSPVNTIIEALTPILISRFLLNLRQLGEPSENETQNRLDSRFSVPRFRVPTLEGMVGNMGADLDHGLAKLEDSEVGDELVEDADMDGGDAEVAVLGAITEDGFGASGHATESV